MKQRKISLWMAITLMAMLVAVTFCITMVYSTNMFNNKMFNLQQRESMYEKLSELDKTVRQYYYGNIEESQLMDMIARGYIAGLGDKYSKYMTAQEYEQMMTQNAGSIVGIGVEITQDASGYILVKTVYDDSPAQNAGIAAGDLIISVEDLAVTAEKYEEAVELLQGDMGTEVKLTVRHDTTDTDLLITRRLLEIPTVYYMVADGEVGYISITGFKDNTPEQFSKALDNLLLNQDIKAIIFDVRGNLGGTVSSTVEILDRLLPSGTIATARYSNGETKVLGTSDSREVDLPMIVLTDEYTASAAELFTQALVDYNKAKTVGTKTYGKGVMQTFYKLSDGSAVELTVAKFYPPVSDNFDKIGIKPDYEVQLGEGQTATEVPEADSDNQYRKALDLAHASIRISQKDEAITSVEVQTSENEGGDTSGEEQEASSEITEEEGEDAASSEESSPE